MSDVVLEKASEEELSEAESNPCLVGTEEGQTLGVFSCEDCPCRSCRRYCNEC